MQLILNEVSCVVAANAHNPTILNHDWLERNNILPPSMKDWAFSEPPIITPPLAQLNYKNGVSIVAETNRLAVTVRDVQNLPPHFVESVKELTEKYVSVLKHVPYTALGTNFKIFVECKDARKKMKEQFAHTGAIKKKLTSVQAKVTYQLDDSLLNVDIVPAQVQKAAEDKVEQIEILVFQGNFHRQVQGYEAVVEKLKKFETDREYFTKYVTDVAGQISG